MRIMSNQTPVQNRVEADPPLSPPPPGSQTPQAPPIPGAQTNAHFIRVEIVLQLYFMASFRQQKTANLH